MQLEGDDPHIVVRGSVTMVGGKRVEGTTKSGRVRTRASTPGTVALMRERAERQAKGRTGARGCCAPGHADPAITLRVYAHVLRDQAVEVAQIFASVVAGRSTRTSWCWQTREQAATGTGR